MMTTNIKLTQWDKLLLDWEQANAAAISAQNERDKKFRLYLVGLGEPVSLYFSDSIELLWKVEAEKRNELELFVRQQAYGEIDELSLLQA